MSLFACPYLEDIMNIPQDLELALEACYEALQGSQLTDHPLDVCLGCCMDVQVHAEMYRLPLRQISAVHLYQYNDTAKSTVQPTQELRFLIPRMLDLVARGQEIHHSPALYLDRLGRREASAFSAVEWQSIEHVCQRIFAHRLSLFPWEFGGLRMFDRALDLLLMFDFGGVDIRPMLQAWLETDSPQATLNYVESTYWTYWCSRSGDINNAFASERPAYRAQMRAWLESGENKAVFAQRILALDLDALPGFKRWCFGKYLTARQVVENTFDAIAG